MSDQDFFFDEDEKPAQKAADKTAKPAAKSAAPKGPPAKGGKSTPVQASGGIELTWTVTALIAVVALLLGVIVGYAIPKGSSVDSPGLPADQSQIQAPQLSPEQMQSGELPEGHPDIGAPSGAASGTTGSGETTPSN